VGLYLVLLTLWGARAFAQSEVDNNAERYLVLAKSAGASANFIKQSAYKVAAVQFSLEGGVAGPNKQCEHLSHALINGAGVKPNHALAKKWQANLAASKHVKQTLYQQTLTWFNSARKQRFSLTGIKQGQCKIVQWPRTFVETEPVFICRRTSNNWLH